ncbi:hypothetical protein [Streptomyces sp. NBC_01508]|uniref:hypothetical protein n=1 Tax=Streptomyces sp. NBC_01508 TaxID=2903888 RepID=UPI003870371D
MKSPYGLVTARTAISLCLSYLGLKVADAATARDWFRRIPTLARPELYAAAMPDDSAELWEQAATADRPAAAWKG